MNKLSIMLFAALLASAFIFSCKDDEEDEVITGTVTFTISGDGYNNQTFTLKDTKSTAPTHEGFYYKGSEESGLDYTMASVGLTASGSGRENDHWSISVKGQGEKSYSWTTGFGTERAPNKNACQIVLHKNGVETAYLSFVALGPNASGSTTITKYGAVGDRIEGTFSGTLYNSDTDKPVTITNGSFSVSRKADVITN
jgi:hypothetical protein